MTVIAAIHTATTTGYSANEYDVVVYGGTPGGITASISAAREGASVILLEQTRRMRSGEVHYIDHPLLGLIIKFTPISGEELAAIAAAQKI